MNAVMALLTAASVLAHAALGCCFHHSHGPAGGTVVDRPLATNEHRHHFGHYHSGDHEHEHSGNDERRSPSPHRHCDEGGCLAVRGAAPEGLLKTGHAACELVALPDLGVVTGRCSSYAEYSRLQHDLGPPLRTHLCNLVLLI